MLRKIILIGSFILTLIQQLYAAGFQRVEIPDPEDKPFTAGIWYPSQETIPEEINTPFQQKLALNAPLQFGSYPVVMISHGYGGWMGSHAATALALSQSGFIVVALTHTGNNYKDDSYPPSRWMQDRPRHIHLTLDFILNEWQYRKHIQPNKVGLFGFSAGGYTALVSSGAIPDISQIQTHCLAKQKATLSPEQDEKVCRLGLRTDPDIAHLANTHKTINWHHDSRIQAAFVAAPALGFSFTSQSLANIKIPLQIWTAAEDKNVPYESNIAPLKSALSEHKSAQFKLVENAGHFAFLPPCNPKLQEFNPHIWSMVCVDEPRFNRPQFHQQLNRSMTDFFKRSLLAQRNSL